ncbi:hypothetical protein ISN45_Aa02g013110 [Arabidopsis thaliana x Arabidopsis arenosa]|uniref:Uncharacterized protein n=2 Tax=Arabidopsis TaxID=3701 RepID=A0A8T2BTP9_ARASU|nr:hypothetical protein ISN45_Aa02g013110 [Arabidopsis thaliana x Arabidopsis arenosa]KAG7589053.1 hypothetical protein ISN44_As07g013700 [Arabidopsis suecica]
MDHPQAPRVTSHCSSIPLLGCIMDTLVHLFTIFSDEEEKEVVDMAVAENRAAQKHFRQLNCVELN